MMVHRAQSKVIITGATGFIGRNLSERLYQDGVKVLATGRDGDMGRRLESKGIEFRGADIVAADQLVRALSPAECLIHCAGKAGDWGAFDEFYKTNVIGTRNAVRACRHHGIGRMIFISTPSVYFDWQHRLDIKESEPLPAVQQAHYSSSKLEAERELFATAGDDLQVIVLRPRAVFGPYDRTFVPRVTRMARKRSFPMIGGGKAIVDVTYIENLIDAVRACLAAPSDAWNEVYNISNGDPITIARWFELLLGVVGERFRPQNIPEWMARMVAAVMEFSALFPFVSHEPLITRFSVGYMSRSMTLSIEKAKKKLGYVPRFDTLSSFENYSEQRQSFRTEKE